MTPDDECTGHDGMIPSSCAGAFGDIRERLSGLEARVPKDLPEKLATIHITLQEVRAAQKSRIRKLWTLGKAAALLVLGALLAALKSSWKG